MNIEAGIDKTKELRRLYQPQCDWVFQCIADILTAMKMPEQKECEHQWDFITGTSRQCVKCNQVDYIEKNRKTEPTLAKKDIYQDFKNKIKVRCCKHGEVSECVYCMKIKDLAIDYFAPLIEKARREGISEGWKIHHDAGKRQATQELKERFNEYVVSWSNAWCRPGELNDNVAINGLKDKLFGAKL